MDFLERFLRSKSEGRSNNKFWLTILFSQIKKIRNQTRTIKIYLSRSQRRKNVKHIEMVHQINEVLLLLVPLRIGRRK